MRSIEIFAGAGGLGMGLHRAGFRPLSIIEHDHHCCTTLRDNVAGGCSLVDGWEIEQRDVRETDFRIFEGKIDLVSGGPPCQPFSQAGKHQAYNDKRDMFPQAIRAIREARPKAFIFENVKGLYRDSFRNYLEYIRLQMEHPDVIRLQSEDWDRHLGRLEQHHLSGSTEGLNYRVVMHVLNAADYGVPQRRERMFFVGFREDLAIRWKFPSPTHSRASLLRSQLDGSYWDRHHLPRTESNEQSDLLADDLLPWVTVRDALSDLPKVDEIVPQSEVANHRFQPGARTYRGHTGSPLDIPAKTIKAGVHGVPGGENMVVTDHGDVRYFTIRELARLQTFPDDFVFYGSWSENIRQIGNAVPVDLATIIGTDIRSHLA